MQRGGVCSHKGGVRLLSKSRWRRWPFTAPAAGWSRSAESGGTTRDGCSLFFPFPLFLCESISLTLFPGAPRPPTIRQTAPHKVQFARPSTTASTPCHNFFLTLIVCAYWRHSQSPQRRVISTQCDGSDPHRLRHELDSQHHMSTTSVPDKMGSFPAPWTEAELQPYKDYPMLYLERKLAKYTVRSIHTITSDNPNRPHLNAPNQAH